MIERPLLFTAPMARAMMNGTKTETRRLTGLEKINERPDDFEFLDCAIRPADGFLYFVFSDKTGGKLQTIKSRYGMAGDFIWGREAHCVESAGYKDGTGKVIFYRADNEEAPHTWTPSIHMPRWASRIHRELADVRVERLQEITKAGVIAEGITEREGCPLADVHAGWHEPYAQLIDKINGRGTWDRNPWVWVLVFKPEARA